MVLHYQFFLIFVPGFSSALAENNLCRLISFIVSIMPCIDDFDNGFPVFSDVVFSLIVFHPMPRSFQRRWELVDI